MATAYDKTKPSADDQTVQTTITEGKWASLQEAAESTGLSEKTLRRYTKRGLVKSRRLGKLANSPIQIWMNTQLTALADMERTSIEGVDEVFEAQEVEEELEEKPSLENGEAQSPKFEMTDVIKTIASEFAQRLDQHKEEIFELRKELHEKGMQLRLLPDLQKQAEDREKLASFEKESLRKQVEELQVENERLRQQNLDSSAKLESKEISWWKKLFLPRPE
jgi:DNA-binding transcriptional MerR regulator